MSKQVCHAHCPRPGKAGGGALIAVGMVVILVLPGWLELLAAATAVTSASVLVVWKAKRRWLCWQPARREVTYTATATVIPPARAAARHAALEPVKVIRTQVVNERKALP